MKKIKSTTTYEFWLDDLKDLAARARIQVRVERLAGGNPGRHRNLRKGVSELCIDTGPGYRVYYTERAGVVVVLLAGGDKSTQKADIAIAYDLVEGL